MPYFAILNECLNMKAKNIVHILILFFTAAPAHAQQFTLEGTIKGREDGVVYLRYAHKPGHYKNDSTLIKDGHFYLQGHTSEPAIAFLTSAKNKLPDDDDKIIAPNGKSTVVFFLEPSAIRVTLDATDLQDAKFSGSKSQTEFAVFNEQPKALINFIDQHSGSYVSAWLLTWHHFPLDTLRRFYNSFPPAIQKSVSGKAVLDNIHKKEAVAVGQRAPAFSMKDKDGEKVALKDFRGRYVLLQFWASTNNASKEENKILLQAYDQYKNKNFTIIGASLDGQKTRKVWTAAVASLPWTHLAPLKARDNPVALKYDVETMPTNFLIDPSGKIIATDLIGKVLQETLHKIFH